MKVKIRPNDESNIFVEFPDLRVITDTEGVDLRTSVCVHRYDESGNRVAFDSLNDGIFAAIEFCNRWKLDWEITLGDVERTNQFLIRNGYVKK